MAAQEGGSGAAPDAAFEVDLARQEAIFEERAGEPLVERPGGLRAVCGGEVFVGDAGAEAASGARATRPGRPFFLRASGPPLSSARDFRAGAWPEPAVGTPVTPRCGDGVATAAGFWAAGRAWLK